MIDLYSSPQIFTSYINTHCSQPDNILWPRLKCAKMGRDVDVAEELDRSQIME